MVPCEKRTIQICADHCSDHSTIVIKFTGSVLQLFHDDVSRRHAQYIHLGARRLHETGVNYGVKLRTNQRLYSRRSTLSRNRLHTGAVLLTVGLGRSYVGNDVTHSVLLNRACACSYENLPKYRSYGVSDTSPGAGFTKPLRLTKAGRSD